MFYQYMYKMYYNQHPINDPSLMSYNEVAACLQFLKKIKNKILRDSKYPVVK